jgi:hypothetical protein
LLDYETPTLGTLLTIVSGWSGFKWMGLIILPVAVAIGWRAGALRDRQTWVDVTLIGSLLTSPFGWSYDNVILLVPLLRAIVLIIEGKFRRAEVFGIGIVLFAANAFAYYQRFLAPSEFYFVWIPILIAAFYAYVWMRRRQIAYA